MGATREAWRGAGVSVRNRGDKAKAETARGPRQESEGVIVVLMRGNARGAKDPWLFRAGRGEKHRRPEYRRRLYVERQTENVTTEGAETS